MACQAQAQGRFRLFGVRQTLPASLRHQTSHSNPHRRETLFVSGVTSNQIIFILFTFPPVFACMQERTHKDVPWEGIVFGDGSFLYLLGYILLDIVPTCKM